jgi:glycerophosphoryl diester phosphodiesterase
VTPDPALAVRRPDGGLARLKWHRARRRAGDPAFTARRIAQALRLGASVEVDLVVHGSGGLAVLHDLSLDRETTGQGPVREATAEALRALRLRGEDGAPLPDPVLLLDDLALLLAQGAHPEALLQLDFKEGQPLDEAATAAFARATAPVARQLILSSGDREAVRRLAARVPGLATGHDPCHFGALDRLRASRDYRGFVAAALADAPEAALIYLDHRLILAAQADGFGLIAAFRAAGRAVDAYTIRRADAEGLAAARALLALGADQITTDDPEGLGRALA